MGGYQNVKKETYDKSIIKTKTQRQSHHTKIYSGEKRNKSSNIPKLYDMCITFLKTNAANIEECGVPYFILEPILKSVKPEVLINIENHNLYLLEDTMNLWKSHCNREFPRKKRMIEDCETWREMYERCCIERQEKFDFLTSKARLSYMKSKFEKMKSHTKLWTDPEKKSKNMVKEQFEKPKKDDEW